MHNLPKEAVNSVWQFDPGSDSASTTPSSRAGDHLKDVSGVAMRVPAANRSVTVRFGLAAGPWKTIAESKGNAVLGGDVVFAPSAEINGSATISVAHRFGDRDVRVVAVGLDGREHLATSNQRGGGGKLYQVTSTFDKVPLKDVKTFRFQTRPYEWIEFRKVSLYAGEKTAVQVGFPAGKQRADDPH